MTPDLITAARAALAALTESVGLVENQYTQDWRHGLPTRASQLEAMRQGVAAHQGAIEQLRTALAAAEAQPVAYRLDYPPEAGIGLPRFYGADDEARMRNHLECVLAAVTPLYESPAAPPQVPQPLSDEQINKHALLAKDCPPNSAVMLVSSIRRLQSHGIGAKP